MYTSKISLLNILLFFSIIFHISSAFGESLNYYSIVKNKNLEIVGLQNVSSPSLLKSNAVSSRISDVIFESCSIVQSTAFKFLYKKYGIKEPNRIACSDFRKRVHFFKILDDNSCKRGYCPVYVLLNHKNSGLMFFDYLSGHLVWAGPFEGGRYHVCKIREKLCLDKWPHLYNGYEGAGLVRTIGQYFIIDSMFTGLTLLNMSSLAITNRSKKMFRLAPKKELE